MGKKRTKILFVLSLSIMSISLANGEGATIAKFSSEINTTCCINFVNKDSVDIDSHQLADSIISVAKKYIGVKYRRGGNGPDRFDCTGFTSFVFKRFGYNLSRTSKDQAKDGREITGDFSHLQKGDILIFGSRRNPRIIGHVGIFIELDSTGRSLYFIHASTTRGIVVSHLSETYYSNRLLGVRRIIPDFIAPDIFSTIQDTSKINNVEPQEVARIVLYGNGTWSMIGDDGDVVATKDSVNYILKNSGEWVKVVGSKRPIPTISPSGPTSSSLRQTSQTKEENQVYHKVKSGETLSSIARRYKTSVESICKLNGIKKTSILKVGRNLRVK